jgi:electron transfer flavoprotein alpha subunit
MRFGDMAPPIDINEYRGCWVFVEQNHGRPARVSLELLGKGKELAEKLGVDLTAIVLGEALGSLPQELIAYGAERVLVAEDALLKDYRTELYANIIAGQVLDRKPEVLIVGATPIGRDLAPRLSFRLNAGCTADCTGLDIDQENRLFVSTRPAFGGNVVATIICPNHRPQMATVRPGVMPLPEKDTTRSGEVVPLKIRIREEELQVKILETVEAPSEGVAIEEAERVVCFGMGGADPETFAMIKEMAELLDAELGATRTAVEAGWLTHDSQVGQTGKTIRPELYVACGISGAVQHTAGMAGSKLVVAINKDSKADIFKYADYGIVGDLSKVLPALIEELKALRRE